MINQDEQDIDLMRDLSDKEAEELQRTLAKADGSGE